MLQTVEAIVEKNGAVRLLEPVHPAQVMRALVTLVEPAEALQPQVSVPTSIFQHDFPQTAGKDIWEVIQAFRNQLEPGDLEPDEDVFADVRDRSPGREVVL